MDIDEDRLIESIKRSIKQSSKNLRLQDIVEGLLLNLCKQYTEQTAQEFATNLNITKNAIINLCMTFDQDNSSMSEAPISPQPSLALARKFEDLPWPPKNEQDYAKTE